MNLKDPDKIIKSVQESIKHHPKAAQWDIEIVKDSLRQEDDWWYLAVRPKKNVRTNDYYELLADVESELQDEKNLNILLVPAAPAA